MAKATAKCICKHCGKTFTMTKDCASRSQADNWESYAKDYYDECPECRKARREAAEAEKYDEVEMFYGDYKKKYADCKTKSGSYNASTKTIIVLIPKAEDALAANSEFVAPEEAEAIDEAVEILRRTNPDLKVDDSCKRQIRRQLNTKIPTEWEAQVVASSDQNRIDAIRVVKKYQARRAERFEAARRREGK